MKKTSNEEKIAEFAHKINKAFDAWDKSLLGWQQYYTDKIKAREELWEEIPETAYVEDFWRIVRSGNRWELRLLAAIETLHKGTPCRTCGANRVKWPDRNCEVCVAAKKEKLEATKESRKALRKRKRLKNKPKSVTKWKLTQLKRK